MMPHTVALAAPLVSLACLSVESPPASGAQDPLEPAFALIRDAVRSGDVPGAIALVARGERTLREEAFGLSDPDNKVPFTTDTLCWMASITKPVTVAAAMTLVDEGRIALDDPVEKHLPEFREQRAADGRHYQFTIRHLMTHTSGLDVNPPTRGRGWPIGGALQDDWLVQRLPDIVRAISETELLFPPGTQVKYSNQAPFVLARVMEVTSGRPYAALVKERLLTPLGMNDSCYAPAPELARRVSPIFGKRGGQLITVFRFKPELRIVNTAPDGGLFTNPGELVRFVRMFLRNDGQVLSRESVDEMLRDQAPGWGLGWAIEDGVFTHGGSSGTRAWFDPATGVIAILFLQYQDDRDTIPRLQKGFWEAVRRAL